MPLPHEISYHLKHVNKAIKQRFITKIKYRYDRENDSTPIIIYFKNACAHECDNNYLMGGQCDYPTVLQQVHNLPFDFGCQQHKAKKCCICERKEDL